MITAKTPVAQMPVAQTPAAKTPAARAIDRAAGPLSVVRTGPSFAAALVGFLSTTVATTILVVLIGTVA